MTQRPSRKPDIQIVTEYNSLVSFWWEEMVQAHDGGSSQDMYNIFISEDGEWLYSHTELINNGVYAISYTICSWFNANKTIITNSYLDYLIEKDIL